MALELDTIGANSNGLMFPYRKRVFHTPSTENDACCSSSGLTALAVRAYLATHWASPGEAHEVAMARNTGVGFRRGAVTARTQFQRGDGHWQKRDERTGQLMEVKSDGDPFKGVARETDGRDTQNS